MRQGKRIGGGMIVGAMSDRFITVAERLPAGVEAWRTPGSSDDIDCLLDPFNMQPQILYIAHRYAGASHDEAMAIAERHFA